MLGSALLSGGLTRLSENRRSSRHRLRPHLVVLIVLVPLAIALGLPANARATPAVTDLAEQAIELDQQGEYAKAAALWERKSATDEGEERTVSLLHAVDAWRAAHAETGAPAHHCAAEALVAQTLAEDSLDRRARADFMSMFEELRAQEVECDPAEQPSDAETEESPAEPWRTPGLSVAPTNTIGPAPRDGEEDRPTPSTVAGAVMLSLAAPLVGGTVYALVDDAAVGSELTAYQGRVDAGDRLSETERLHIEELGGRAIRDRSLALGLGISGAVLSGIGVGLLIHGRRARATRGTRLSLQPRLGRDAAGLVLGGRF